MKPGPGYCFLRVRLSAETDASPSQSDAPASPVFYPGKRHALTPERTRFRSLVAAGGNCRSLTLDRYVGSGLPAVLNIWQPCCRAAPVPRDGGDGNPRLPVVGALLRRSPATVRPTPSPPGGHYDLIEYLSPWQPRTRCASAMARLRRSDHEVLARSRGTLAVGCSTNWRTLQQSRRCALHWADFAYPIVDKKPTSSSVPAVWCLDRADQPWGRPLFRR